MVLNNSNLTGTAELYSSAEGHAILPGPSSHYARVLQPMLWPVTWLLQICWTLLKLVAIKLQPFVKEERLRDVSI